MATNIWNPFLETLPLDMLQDIQFKRFKKIFKHAYHNSPFHKKKYDEASINIDSIKAPADTRLIPLTAKDDFRDAQGGRESFPYGEVLAVPIEEVTSYHQTTGTTGEPVRFADTWADWEMYAENWAMMMYSRGLRKSDRPPDGAKALIHVIVG